MRTLTLDYGPLLLTIILASVSNLTSANPLRCGCYVELEPFYVKATDTLLTNSIFAIKIADPNLPHDFKKQYHLDLQNQWGARIAVGYDFPCCANYNYGLLAEYTFFDHENNASVENNSRNSTGLPVIAPAEFIDITDEASARFSRAESSLSQDYQTFDFLAVKNIALNCCADLKLFGGLRYFHLEERLHNRYTFEGEIESVEVTNIYDINFKNNLDNVGPHAGGRLFYRLIYGFGIKAQLAASLLYGTSTSEFKNSYHLSPDSTLGETTRLTSSNHHDSAAHFVPVLSGKVAIAFEQIFQNCSSVILEAGFRGDRYFHAADDVAFQQLLAGDDINSNSNFQDFDLTGFYLGLSFHC